MLVRFKVIMGCDTMLLILNLFVLGHGWFLEHSEYWVATWKVRYLH